MTTNDHQDGLIEEAEDVRRFVLAGNAKFTIVSMRTGERFTFKVKSTPDRDDGRPKTVTHFVSVLTSSDNESSYTYLGNVYRDGEEYAHGRKSRITAEAKSAMAFEWLFRKIIMERRPPASVKLEFWHSGCCGRCGRTLTVPESIARGIGPECWARGGNS